MKTLRNALKDWQAYRAKKKFEREVASTVEALNANYGGDWYHEHGENFADSMTDRTATVSMRAHA